MGILLQNHVKELELQIFPANDQGTRYTLPQTVFTAKSLTALKLHHLHNLKKVRISGLKEVEINAPSLQSFSYNIGEGDTFVLNIDSSCDLKVLHLEGLSIGDQLFKNLMSKFPLLEDIHLQYVKHGWPEMKICDAEELEETYVTKVPEIEHLNLKIFWGRCCCESLLDGLFRSCHPKNLSLKEVAEHPDTDLLKKFFE
ncbi:unnamed protein product [Camellia sinensis]